MTKYRKKPVVIEVFKFDGTVDCLRKNVDEHDWSRFRLFYGGMVSWYISLSKKGLPQLDLDSCLIETLEGPHKVSNGDYIIKGVQGEYYSCKPDVFKKAYEKVTDDKGDF